METLRKNPKERGMERSIVFYFPLALTVVGTLLYHLAQKTMPRAVSPFALLAVAFATALALCLLLLLFAVRSPLLSMNGLNWSSLGPGFSVVLIVSVYLVAYI